MPWKNWQAKPGDHRIGFQVAQALAWFDDFADALHLAGTAGRVSFATFDRNWQKRGQCGLSRYITSD